MSGRVAFVSFVASIAMLTSSVSAQQAPSPAGRPQTSAPTPNEDGPGVASPIEAQSRSDVAPSTSGDPSSKGATVGRRTTAPAPHTGGPLRGVPPHFGTSLEFARLSSILELHAENQRDRRLALNVSSLGLGVAGLTLGLIASEVWDYRFGTYVWVTGALTFVSGVVGFFSRSPLESLYGRLMHAKGRIPDDVLVAHVEGLWSEMAASERKSRIVGGWVELGLGALAAGFGVVALTSSDLIDTDPSARRAWGTFFVLAGLAASAGGVVSLLTRGPTETGFAAYLRGKAYPHPSTLRISAGPLRGGGLAGVSATF